MSTDLKTPISMEPGQGILYQSREEVRALQHRLIHRTLRIARTAHPFYSRVMAEAGIEDGDIDGLETLARLPVTYKTMFLEDPEAFRLGPHPDLTTEEIALREIMYTTGTTTGVPAPIYTTTSDFYTYMIHAARCSEMLGITKDDRIANVFPMTPYPMGAYVRAAATAAATGCTVMNTHTGQGNDIWPVHQRLDDAIRMIERHRSTGLWGISGFVRRLLIRAAEIGADLSALRMSLVTGEATTPAMKADMVRLMAEVGSKECLVLNRYGSTEASSMIQCEDDFEAGWHNPSPDMTFLETVHPDTHEPTAPGEPGLLLITHLSRRGTMLLRYAVGDIVTLDWNPCTRCGRTSERIVSQPLRTKEIIKIKGTLVNVAALSEALDAMPEVIEHQVILEKPSDDPLGSDVIRVRVAARGEADIADRVKDAVRKVSQITPTVEMVEANDIFDPERGGKRSRLVDLRPSVA